MLFAKTPCLEPPEQACAENCAVVINIIVISCLAINEAMFGGDVELFRAAAVGSLMLIGVVAYGLMPRQDDANDVERHGAPETGG